MTVSIPLTVLLPILSILTPDGFHKIVICTMQKAILLYLSYFTMVAIIVASIWILKVFMYLDM